MTILKLKNDMKYQQIIIINVIIINVIIILIIPSITFNLIPGITFIKEDKLIINLL